jgi:SPP1 gp7 family putative phage head morphogenesis protein
MRRSVTQPWHQGDDPASAVSWQEDADQAAREFVGPIWDALASVSPEGIALAWLSASGVLKTAVRGAVPAPPLAVPGPPTPPSLAPGPPPDPVMVEAAHAWLEARGFLDVFAQSLAATLPLLWARAWSDGVAQAQAMIAQPLPESKKKPRKKRRKRLAASVPGAGPPPVPPVPVVSPGQTLASLLSSPLAGFAAWATQTMLAAEVALIVGSLAARVSVLLAAALAGGWTMQRLSDALERAFVTRWRSQMIAGTEAARAANAAMLAVYALAGVKWVRWITRHDGRVCLDCRANEAKGTIRLGTAFPSGDKTPPNHPNCRCYLRPSNRIMRMIGKDDDPGLVKAKPWRDRSDPVGERVYQQLLPDYPAHAIGWVRSAEWTGPVQVPVQQVNYTPEKWAAGHEPAKVDEFKRKIKAQLAAGREPKPAVLIDRPDTDRGTHLIVIDGHHHAMAYHELGEPIHAYVGKVDLATARVAERSHEYQYTTDHPGATDAAASKGKGKLRAGALVVHAADTGRVFMLRRHQDPGDDAGGRWEFPGGRMDDGESPVDAAFREWAEEVRCLPPEGVITGWADSSNGKHRLFFLTVPSESVIPDEREHVIDPDHPGAEAEETAWWHPREMMSHPDLRMELAADWDQVMALTSSAFKSAETPMLMATPDILGPHGLWHTPDEKVPYKQKLPNYIEHIAHALMRDHGMSESQAIATAINAVKRWSRGHLGWGHRRHVTPEVEAASGETVGAWEALRATHHR